MPSIIYLAIGGIILTIGDIIFKFYAQKPQVSLYTSGLLIYLLGLTFLVQSFKNENIAVASTIFVIVNVATLSLVSWLYFKEPLSIYQIAGIIVACIGIVLLELGK